ncbi:MAG: site-specific DNA-methyltransferase [Minicystis sp.]
MKQGARKVPELVWGGKRSRTPATDPAPRLVTAEIAGAPRDLAWRDKLIRADNRHAMRALLPDLAGKIDLVYVDPPFGTGGSFSLTARGAGGADVPAYSDRWTLGLDEYLSTMLEQLELIRALLSDRGTVFVHCDWHVSHYLRCLLDEVFGADAFKNEIVWRYRRWPAKTRVFQRMHDVIFWYGRAPGDAHAWTPQYEPLAASTIETWGTKRQIADFSSGRRKPSQTDEETPGAPMSDVWDIGIIAPIAKERVGYPTQKPEALLRRVIEAASRPGDLVADFFAGSGTTLAVAHKLGRRFVGCDSGRVAIHAARKRLLGLGASFELLEIDGATADASLPAVAIHAEPAGGRGEVRLRLDDGGAEGIDYWAVDWDHDGRIFRTGWHASREGKKRTLPLTAEHAFAAGGSYRIAVLVAGAHGGEGRHEIVWSSK